MTKEEKQKAINALKISAPIKALTQEEFNDYIQTLNKVMDWLEQEPILDKIRAEIIELRSKQNVGVLECLDIIDKYKTERSDK